MEAQRQSALNKIRTITEDALDHTRRAIKSIHRLGMDPPEEMLLTQNDHETILIEVNKKHPSMKRITILVERIEKRVVPMM